MGEYLDNASDFALPEFGGSLRGEHIYGEMRPASPPKLTSGRLILGKLVIPNCPHCGGRHRHRFKGFDTHYEALCAASGGYLVQREASS